MFRSHMTRVLVLSLALLALSAAAAQARPIGAGYTGSAPYSTSGYHTFYRPTPGSGQVPVIVPTVKSAPQPAAAASTSGFSWTTALIGAGVIGMVLLLAAIPASRIRPRRVAQL